MVLPEIVALVRGRIPVFVDCGITSGVDAFKALALGASAVSVGRELMTALTQNGAAGVRQRIEEMYRGQKIVPDLIPKIRIEIAVNDSFVDIATDAILQSAKTNGPGGTVGDGKIFITPLEECIRIRTGEKGPSAI
jgi:nitrogen regulatory protein P-II 1